MLDIGLLVVYNNKHNNFIRGVFYGIVGIDITPPCYLWLCVFNS